MLCQISGYSRASLGRLKGYWLEQIPQEQFDYAKVKYLIYDATYFHKDGCLLNLMDAVNQKIIAHHYVKKESFVDTLPWFSHLQQQGLSPQYITTDGEQSVLRAMRRVWPQARLQRCLYHLQHEGMRWLRSYPRTEAGQQLRNILSQLSRIKIIRERDAFLEDYIDWLQYYRDFVHSLPRTNIAYKDLQRTIVLLNNALPDMFYYLEDHRIHATTNALEGFHSRLKSDYQRHRGLNKSHKIGFIHWYCYFHNRSI